MQGRLHPGAALLLCALMLAACSGSKKTPAQPTPPPTETAAAASPTPAPPPPDLASQIGVRADLPAFDPVDLAARYGDGVPAARSKPFASEANVGDKRSFSVAELSGAVFSHSAMPALRGITATIRVKSAHAYFYEDDSLDVADADIQRSADSKRPCGPR